MSVAEFGARWKNNGWTPPPPVLSPREISKNKAAPVTPPDFELPQGRSLTKDEALKSLVLDAPLRHTGETALGTNEMEDLTQLLAAYSREGGLDEPGNGRRLKAFVATHPQSGFNTSLLIEAAEVEWRHGAFVQSVETLRDAWLGSKNLQAPDDRRLAERALGCFLERSFLLGRKDDIRTLVVELKDRELGGYATNQFNRAKEALWSLENEVEANVFCGFDAVNTVCVPLGEKAILPEVPSKEKEKELIERGISALELAALSQKGGGTLRVVKRVSGTRIVAPAVVHWKFGHYSAITEVAPNKVRVSDKQLGFDSWMPMEVLEDQMSGYFLLPSAAGLPEGFAEASYDEAATVFGRFCTHVKDTEGDQPLANPDPPCPGMARYNFTLLNPGLAIQDIPLEHRPPFGPAVSFTVRYDQRSLFIDQPIPIGHIGPRWTHAFREWVALNGSGAPNTIVNWNAADGDYFRYNYNSTTQSYTQKYADRPQLVYLTAPQGGPGYQLNFPDGSKKLFKQPNSGTPNKYFLTQIVDPAGNALTLQYDVQLRLTSITDALGQATTISYTPEVGDNFTSDTTLIRSVTDPFSRVAKFKYTTTGQLWKIIDPVGIVSEFGYGTGDFVTHLTTPYGTTEFRHGGSEGLNQETIPWVESMDAAGDRERVESNNDALPSTYVANPAAPTTVNVNGTNVGFLPKNTGLSIKNTFHWDRKQMRNWPGDPTKCRIYNWLTLPGGDVTAVQASVKDPLEGRVWYNYPGQTNANNPGSSSTPNKVVRAVESTTGTTVWAMSQTTYNVLGRVTGTVDPQGREMKYEYYANNQDVQYVKVKNGGGWETLATISQYKTVSGQSIHLPEIITDVSGLQTQYSYNDQGQVTQVTVSKGGNSETTKYIYDSDLDGNPDTSGYLIRVEHTDPSNPVLFVTLQSYTYDAAKRVRTVTNSDGYTLTYDYDNLNRVTLVTHPDSTTEQMVYANPASQQTLDVWAAKDRAGRWTQMRYSQHRQVVMQIDPLSRITQFEWCRCGSLSKLIDPMGKVTTWKRDAQGRVTEKLLSDGKRYLYTYEPLSGRLATVSYPKDVLASQVTFTNRYHLNGQLQKKDYTDAGMADVTFTAADFMGRSTGMTDGIGTYTPAYVALTGTPNGAGALATMNGPLADDTLRYTYDWKGRMVKNEIVADNGTTITRSEESTLDSLGRATQVVNNLGTFTATYNSGNLSGQPDSVALPGGFSTLYSRYAANAGANALRLQTIHHKQGVNTVQKHDYAYDLTGNITTWDRTNATADVSSWALRHDAADQLVELDESLNSVAQKKQAWHYDAAGNMASSMNVPTGLTGTMQIRTHTGRNQLTQMGGTGKTMVEGTTDEAATVTVNGEAAKVTKIGASGPWRFERELDFPSGATTVDIEATDGASNVTAQSYSVNVSASADQTLTYDANGNLIQVANASSVVIRICEWDAENRLLAIQSAATPALGVKRSEFTYDGGGRRVALVEKEHNGTSWVTQSSWQYYWNGLALVQKRDASSGTNLATYFRGGEQQGSDAIVYQPDHLGSVRQWYRVSDGLQGAAEFSAWGVRSVAATGPGIPERGYTGHLHHAVSELVLAPFRAFDPEAGRWISEDPIEEEGGGNLYRYVNNLPVHSIDRLGLDIWYDSGGGGHAVVIISDPASPTGYTEYNYLQVTVNVHGNRDLAAASDTWNVPGLMTKTHPNASTVEAAEIRIITTPEIDAEARAVAEKIRANPGDYNPLFNNCVHKAREIIGVAIPNIKTTAFENGIDTPTQLKNDIKKSKDPWYPFNVWMILPFR